MENTFKLTRFCHYICYNNNLTYCIWHWLLGLIYLVELTRRLEFTRCFIGCFEDNYLHTQQDKSPFHIGNGLSLQQWLWSAEITIEATFSLVYLCYFLRIHTLNIKSQRNNLLQTCLCSLSLVLNSLSLILFLFLKPTSEWSIF